MRSLRLLLLLAIQLVFNEPSHACLNNYVTNEKAVAAAKNIAEQLTKVELIEKWDARRDRLQKELFDGNADYKTRTDLANALMHTGNAKQAVVLLEEVEAKHPGLYPTASNLGTAYELVGENQKALEWIRKGIDRNPLSHNGTEWLHVRILNAKIAASNNPKWWDDNTVLGIDFDNFNAAVFPNGNDGQKLTLEQIETALTHQLRERLQFVKPRDSAVGQLLLDLGRIIAKKPEGIGMAESIFEMAGTFAPEGSADLFRSSGLHRSSNRANQNESWDETWKLPLIFALGIICPLAAVALYRRTKARRAR